MLDITNFGRINDAYGARIGTGARRAGRAAGIDRRRRYAGRAFLARRLRRGRAAREPREIVKLVDDLGHLTADLSFAATAT